MKLRFGRDISLCVAFLCAVGTAHADFVFTLGSGTITAPASVEFGNRTDTQLTVHTGPPLSAPYNFLDTWNFVLAGGADVTSFAAAFKFDDGPGGLNTFGVENLQIGLFDSANVAVSTGWQSVTAAAPITISSSTTPFAGFAAGAYSLQVRGTLLAPPGSYAGTLIASTPAAVPLPAALPLLVLGLGTLGAAGIRRRKASAAA